MKKVKNQNALSKNQTKNWFLRNNVVCRVLQKYSTKTSFQRIRMLTSFCFQILSFRYRALSE